MTTMILMDKKAAVADALDLVRAGRRSGGNATGNPVPLADVNRGCGGDWVPYLTYACSLTPHSLARQKMPGWWTWSTTALADDFPNTMTFLAAAS